MEEQKLNIINYTEYPGPRYSVQGKNSGEDFYHSKLNEAFTNAYELGSTLSILLDGTAGYPSSFLDEAFGNLIFDFSLEVVSSKINIISDQEPDWKSMIINDVFTDWENRRIKNNPPKKTKKHAPWFRIENGELVKKVWL